MNPWQVDNSIFKYTRRKGATPLALFISPKTKIHYLRKDIDFSD